MQQHLHQGDRKIIWDMKTSTTGKFEICHIRPLHHIMDWNDVRVISAESNKYQRRIREAFEIRKQGPRSMNRGESAYTLSHTWDAVLEKALDS